MLASNDQIEKNNVSLGTICISYCSVLVNVYILLNHHPSQNITHNKTQYYHT